MRSISSIGLGALEVDAYHQFVHRVVATDSSVSMTMTGPNPNSCPRINAAPPKPEPAASPIR